MSKQITHNQTHSNQLVQANSAVLAQMKSLNIMLVPDEQFKVHIPGNTGSMHVSIKSRISIKIAFCFAFNTMSLQ